MSKNAIQFKSVVKSFGGKAAVDHLDLTIEHGETVALVGASGCGKTTTLKMINRLIEPTSGAILVNGEDIRSLRLLDLRRSLGYVIQQVGLFPHMSIADNVAIVPQLLGWDRTRILNRVDELLNLVHLPPDQFRRRRPFELSGGQQQRVGVARALAADPPILLMDEPFGALDPITRDNLQKEIMEIQRKLKKAIVIVTHDMEEAVRLGDRIVVMEAGRISQDGPPAALLTRPATPFVSSLLGESRAIKLLQTIAVSRCVAASLGTESGLPEIAETATMYEALGVFLKTGKPMLAVVGAKGERKGDLSREKLFELATSGEGGSH